ncbi:MAG: GNAT family N-acetyltransferase [Actinomycetota bacterium]
MDDVLIVRAGAERLDELEPLWKSLQEHHRSVDPGVPGIPPRSADDSWPRRRVKYVEWLLHPDAFVLLAEGSSGPVGYALVSIHEPADDTHVTGERWAELQSLSIEPSRRRTGLGTRLMERIYEELRTMKVEELAIGVIATNLGAMRFYERQGFHPWVVTTLGKVPGSE